MATFKLVFRVVDSDGAEIFPDNAVEMLLDAADLKRDHVAELGPATARGDIKAVEEVVASKIRVAEATEAAAEMARRFLIIRLREWANASVST